MLSELQVEIGADDLFPAVAVEKAHGLHNALQRNEIASNTKVGPLDSPGHTSQSHTTQQG